MIGTSRANTMRVRAMALAAILIGAPALVHAQEPTATLTDLALEWSRGRYITPLICRIGDTPHRAQRRGMIAPGPKRSRKTKIQVRFYRMLFPEKPSGCFSDLGLEEFDIDGSFLATIEGTSRADSLERDFQQTLERRGGFDLHIESSELRLYRIDEDGVATTALEVSVKEARIELVRRSSDLARILSEFEQHPLLQVTLVLSNDQQVQIPLVRMGLR